MLSRRELGVLQTDILWKLLAGPMKRETEAHLVSVLVPAYNAEPYLREALDSILAQTYPRLEVLLLDDASTDATPAIAESYGDAIRVLRQETNRGIYDNADAGIAKARGKYIAIFHADDVYGPTIVEREVAFLERHPGAGAVFCADVLVDERGEEYGRLELPAELRGERPLDFSVILNTILTHMNRYLPCPSSMVPAAVYRELGGYRQHLYGIAADLDMWLRIARQHPIGILEDHLWRYRHSASQSSRSYHHLRTDPETFFRIMDDHLRDGAGASATRSAIAAYEAHRAEDQLFIAVSHYIRGELPAARRALAGIAVRWLLGSPHIQRGRLFVLFLALEVLTRLPRIAPVADVFYRRWHRGQP